MARHGGAWHGAAWHSEGFINEGAKVKDFKVTASKEELLKALERAQKNIQDYSRKTDPNSKLRASEWEEIQGHLKWQLRQLELREAKQALLNLEDEEVKWGPI